LGADGAAGEEELAPVGADDLLDLGDAIGAELAEKEGRLARGLGGDLTDADAGLGLSGVVEDLEAEHAPADVRSQSAEPDEAAQLGERGCVGPVGPDDGEGHSDARLDAPDHAVAAVGEFAAGLDAVFALEKAHALEREFELVAIAGVQGDDLDEPLHGIADLDKDLFGRSGFLERGDGEVHSLLSGEVVESGEGVLGGHDAGEFPRQVAVNTELS
jgi:hypothetical protein